MFDWNQVNKPCSSGIDFTAQPCFGIVIFFNQVGKLFRVYFILHIWYWQKQFAGWMYEPNDRIFQRGKNYDLEA